MNKKLTRRAVLGTVVGLTFIPFVMRYSRRAIPKWEMSDDIVLYEDLLQIPRTHFFEEWKALRKPFLAEPKMVRNAPNKVMLRPDLSKPLKWHFRMLGTHIKGNWTSLEDFAADSKNAEKPFWYTVIEGLLTAESGNMFVDIAKNERKWVKATTNSEGESPMITTQGGSDGIVLAIDGKPVSAKNKHEFFLCRIETEQFAADRFEYEVVPENKPPVVTVLRSQDKYGVMRSTTRSTGYFNGRAGWLTPLTKHNGLPTESVVLRNNVDGVLLNPYVGEYPTDTVIQLPNKRLFQPDTMEPTNIRVDSVKELNEIRSVGFSCSGKNQVCISASGESAYVVRDRIHRISIDNGLVCWCFDRLAPSDAVNGWTRFTEFSCSPDKV
ncbi:hypothetical protein FACS1894170_02950 [Planctomycetales bacterium]|nr:hypothetical protein FACS1894170_02950 [Planctomycetales bacterium]